jgi:hypothetical protein
MSSRTGILGTHPAVYVRVANKGDKPGQRTGLEVRPRRTTAGAGEEIKNSARVHGSNDGERIARSN